MSAIKISALLTLLSCFSRISAHGTVQGIVAEGVWYQGYSPNFQYQNPPPTVAGWSIPEDQDNGFVSDYTSPDIICHKGATPGGAYVKVNAGDTVELQWTPWPASHHGPMLDYLASCGEDCTTVDKTQLLWNKIDAVGLVDDTTPPGTWGDDQMIANNNSWVTTIPSSIAPGKYVLRHETIALHSAENAGGAQNYPQCINLEVSGTGTDPLSTGTVGTSLYTATDPGILVNIYVAISSYIIPGPTLYSGAANTAQPTGSSSSSNSTGPFSNTTSTSATSMATSMPIAITSTVSSDIAIAPTTTAATTTSTPDIVASSAILGSSSTISTSIAASPTAVGPASSMPAASSTMPAPVSFSSTLTGRIGKPTKFVCYVEE